MDSSRLDKPDFAQSNQKCLLYQDLVVLFSEGHYPTLHGFLLIGLFDADVCHIWEVTVCLELLETPNEFKTVVCLCTR